MRYTLVWSKGKGERGKGKNSVPHPFEKRYITPKNRKSDRLFLIGLTLFLAIIVLGFATLTVMLIRYLWNAFS